MSISMEGKLGDVASLLREGVSKHLQEAIKRLVKEECDRIIEEAVKEVAKAAGKLVAEITRDPMHQEVVVYLKYEDKPMQEFKPGQWVPAPKRG